MFISKLNISQLIRDVVRERVNHQNNSLFISDLLTESKITGLSDPYKSFLVECANAGDIFIKELNGIGQQILLEEAKNKKKKDKEELEEDDPTPIPMSGNTPDWMQQRQQQDAQKAAQQAAKTKKRPSRSKKQPAPAPSTPPVTAPSPATPPPAPATPTTVQQQLPLGTSTQQKAGGIANAITGLFSRIKSTGSTLRGAATDAAKAQKLLDDTIKKVTPSIPQNSRGMLDFIRKAVQQNPGYTNVAIGVLVNAAKLAGGPVLGLPAGTATGLLLRTLVGTMRGETIGQAAKKATYVTIASLGVGAAARGVSSALHGTGFGQGVSNYFTGNKTSQVVGQTPQNMSAGGQTQPQIVPAAGTDAAANRGGQHFQPLTGEPQPYGEPYKPAGYNGEPTGYTGDLEEPVRSKIKENVNKLRNIIGGCIKEIHEEKRI